MTGQSRRSCLVLAPRFPLPKHSGTQIREYHALVALAERFDVTLVSLVQDDGAMEYVSELENMGVSVETVQHDRSRNESLARFCTTTDSYRVCRFVTPEFRRRVSSVCEQREFDLIWVNFATTLPALPGSVSAPVVVDEHNEDIRSWESFFDGGLLMRAFARANIWKLHRFNRRITDRVDAFLAVSEADAERTRTWAEGTPVWTVPNGVETDMFETDDSASVADEVVRFVGSLDVRMNVDALDWFTREVWPAVVDRRPDAEFEIVGRNPTEAVLKLDEIAGVRVRGPVDSVVPYYDSAALTVAPFRFGGGSKLKVLESLSMRRPVVSTPTGSVGLDVSSDVGVVVREDSSEFANAVVELLADPTKRTRLGDAGREFVTRNYAWTEIMREGIERVESSVL